MHINTTLPFNVRGKSPATHHKVRLKTAAYPKVNSLLNNVGGLKILNHSLNGSIIIFLISNLTL